MVFHFINIINSKQGTGEGGEFAEGYEEGLMDLSLRVDIHPAKEEYEPANGEHGGCQELYEVVVSHRRCCWRRILSGKMDEAIIPPRRRPLLPFRREDVPGAKVR